MCVCVYLWVTEFLSNGKSGLCLSNCLYLSLSQFGFLCPEHVNSTILMFNPGHCKTTKERAPIPYISTYSGYWEDGLLHSPFWWGRERHAEPILSAWTHQNLLTWKEGFMLLGLLRLLAFTIQTQQSWQLLELCSPNTEPFPYDWSGDFSCF